MVVKSWDLHIKYQDGEYAQTQRLSLRLKIQMLESATLMVQETAHNTAVKIYEICFIIHSFKFYLKAHGMIIALEWTSLIVTRTYFFQL